MAITTATPPRTAPRTHRRWRTARSDLAQAYASIAKTASEARHRYRRPSLVISSFGSIDAGIWHTFGMGVGLIALGLLGLVFEAIGDDK